VDKDQQVNTGQLSEEYGEQFLSARAEIIDYLHRSGAASISVAVAKGGEILWEDAFGWANREERIAATPHTMYSLASIAKSITATGIMVLADRGLIDIEQPVDDYLGPVKLTPYAGKAQEATVKRVLGHRAGLPDHWHFFYENEAARRPPMDETIRKYGIIVYPPGEAMCYSNIGFGILDYVLARVSGKSYAGFLKGDVFLPLGMTHSSVGIGPGLEAYAAQRYDANQHPIPFYDFDHWGGSSVFSSAHDLVRFGMFFLKDRLADQVPIMSDETIGMMHREHEYSPGPMRYGLGWILEDVRGFHTVKHTGGCRGSERGSC
jgi:CubicO group peptidase (beta-lactamase class C family)